MYLTEIPLPRRGIKSVHFKIIHPELKPQSVVTLLVGSPIFFVSNLQKKMKIRLLIKAIIFRIP